MTTGGSGGNTISGFGGMAFNGGLTLVGGPVSVISNGSTLSFGGPVTGAENLTLNALTAGAGTVTGLAEIGFASNLTALNVTAQTLSLPSTGLAVAGPMSFTAAGGITVNGAVGNASGPATAAITFNGPVTLASGAITVTTNNAAVNFESTVNGAEALSVNAGTGTTTFSAAVGGNTPLASLSMNSGDPTEILGGSIHTSGAQIYGDAVILGANTTLTGDGVQFAGTVDGAYALTVNDAGTTTFGGIVGGNTPLTSPDRDRGRRHCDEHHGRDHHGRANLQRRHDSGRRPHRHRCRHHLRRDHRRYREPHGQRQQRRTELHRRGRQRDAPELAQCDRQHDCRGERNNHRRAGLHRRRRPDPERQSCDHGQQHHDHRPDHARRRRDAVDRQRHGQHRVLRIDEHHRRRAEPHARGRRR